MKIDESLIKQIQVQIHKSNQKAFEDLYKMFFPRLFNFSLLYVHRKEAAEEIVNDVMVKIWNARETINEIINLETYLFVAVRNHSLNYLQKYSRMQIVMEPETGFSEIASLHDPEKDLEWKEIQLRLKLAVEQLPDQCRTVFKLIKEEGFKYKQVAEILGISTRTVETQLFRAIKKLSNTLEAFRGKPQSKKDKGNFPLTILFLF